jgi:hypothetical protein
MGSDSGSAAGSAFGEKIGLGLVIGLMRKVDRGLVEAATTGLTQGEKLLVVAPARSAGVPVKLLGVVLTNRRLIVFRASMGGRLKGVLLDVPHGQVSVLRFRSYPLNFGASLALRFDEAVSRSSLKLIFNAYGQQRAKALRDALTSPRGDVTV